jgi:hypothetical protein
LGITPPKSPKLRNWQESGGASKEIKTGIIARYGGEKKAHKWFISLKKLKDWKGCVNNAYSRN